MATASAEGGMATASAEGGMATASAQGGMATASAEAAVIDPRGVGIGEVLDKTPRQIHFTSA